MLTPMGWLDRSRAFINHAVFGLFVGLVLGYLALAGS
jgi:hypothetical protein